ncbi:MAG: ribonuclease domain-containing protein [Candidatus Limivicinus sp.]|nr:ribonuclease domain-containing protein [Candidatus Limivicinus sp.]
MKLKKILPIIVLAALLIFALLPGEQSTDVGIIGGADGPTAIFVTSPTDSPSGDTAAEPAEPDSVQIHEDGAYTTKEDVALYIHTYGCLPSNFVTKDEAKQAGWEGGSLEKYLPGKCIGGDRFGNREGLLPDAPGRTWTECDINTLGASSRGAERIVFSNDGLIYYTGDHYDSFELLYG